MDLSSWHYMRVVEVRRFLKESLAIEGILRRPSDTEIAATLTFLDLTSPCMWDLNTLQAVYAPGKPLRDGQGMNVRVGGHVPPPGGPQIPVSLAYVLTKAYSREEHPYATHCRFETLHPYMDGNGRTGRTLWAWQMLNQGMSPFSLPFLHRWYYQSLQHSR